MKNSKRLSLGILLSIISSSNSFAQDNVTQYKYDARGRLVKVTDNAGAEIYYALDYAGNRTNVSDTPYNPPTTPPIVTSFTGPSTVNSSGTFVTLSWSSTDTMYCALAKFGDYSSNPNLPTSGSTAIRIYEDTAVTITCYYGELSDSKGKLIRVESSGGRELF